MNKKCLTCGCDILNNKRYNKYCNRECYLTNKPVKHDWVVLQQDYDSGLTLRELNKKYGISVTTLKKAAKQGKFKIRSVSEAIKLDIKQHGSRFGDSKDLSRYRKYQLEVEESLSNDLRLEGYEIFSPTVVCDRIAIKDGQLYFIDFKPNGQSLRYAQQLVSDTTKDSYKVVFYDKEKYKNNILYRK